MQRRSKKRNKQQDKDASHKLMSRSWLRQISPRKGYHFYSDYFTIDKGYATIMTIFNKQGADRRLCQFWGIKLLPLSLGRLPGVTIRLFMTLNSTTDKWYESHQKNTDRQMATENADAKKQGTEKQTLNAYKNQDLIQISRDHTAGDEYMWVAFRLMIKAPTLDLLDKTVKKVELRYKQGFEGIYPDRYQGRQREELSNLFVKASDQIGNNYMFTSSELAGEYNLVTQGINDPYGVYVGNMKGDVNHSAVVWDIDDFTRHVVIASDDKAELLDHTYKFPKNTRGSAIWATKLTQVALTNRHRVVHLVLNGTDIEHIGQEYPEITARVGMNDGALNPFEIFGKIEDELTLYPAHIRKLKLMAKQLSPSLTDTDLHKNLDDLLQDYYIDFGMWHKNASMYRDKLRIAELPHNQYPKLNRFNSYLETARKSAVNHHDMNKVASIEKLQGVFSRMLNDNPDLFNCYTDSSIDDVRKARQIIYDFSSLDERGNDIMMAQFVNALSFAIGELQENDVVILHGAEFLNKDVRSYTSDMFDVLRKKDIRVVYVYDDITKCLEQASFCKLSEADYLLFGSMTDPQVKLMEEKLNRQLPGALQNLVTVKDPTQWYLRRDWDNIILAANPLLKVTPAYKQLLHNCRLDTPRGRHTGPIYIDFKGKGRQV